MLEFLAFISEQWILVSLLLIFIYLYVWRESSKGGQQVTHHELTRLVNADNAVVIDIRDPKEYKSGHIAGSMNIPYSKIKDHLAELKSHQDKTLVLVDKYGQHSGAAGRELSRAGLNPARLKGGLGEWQVNNLPLVRSN